MAKSKKKSKANNNNKNMQETKKKLSSSLLEQIEAMSSDDEQDVPPESEWNAEALALKNAITSGKFDKLVQTKVDEEDGDDFEDVVLPDNSDDDDDDGDGSDDDDDDDDDDADKRDNKESNKQKVENDNDSVVEETDEEEEEEEEVDDDEQSDSDEDAKNTKSSNKDNNLELVKESDDDDDDDDNDEDKDMDPVKKYGIAYADDDEDDDDDARENIMLTARQRNTMSAKSLAVVSSQIQGSKKHLPWAETFDIIPRTPLPFGIHGNKEENPLGVHDDLKREVAFYNLALEAVKEAKGKCKKAGIPFTRPDDFFAEMVKTDEHMAKVKDRLIFETKKMDAVAQRKSNREQKLRAKESHANKLAEKAKRKKDHFRQVEDWANSVSKNRGGALVDDDDDGYLEKIGGRNNTGPSKKRIAANQKYGFGGKRGRFKQNDEKSMNDFSGYNPQGNFAGGMKKRAGTGASRPGKRARDAKRARKH